MLVDRVCVIREDEDKQRKIEKTNNNRPKRSHTGLHVVHEISFYKPYNATEASQFYKTMNALKPMKPVNSTIKVKATELKPVDPSKPLKPVKPLKHVNPRSPYCFLK